MTRARAVVIGGGAIGTSCFYHLTRRGLHDVLLLEQASLAAGSSGRSAAVVETQYLTEGKIALTAWSMAVVRRLARDHGLPFVRHGYLRLGHTPDDLERFRESVALQRRHGVPDAVVLDRAGVARRFPRLLGDDFAGALFGPSDGYIDPVRMCELFVALGKDAGGRVRQGGRVTGIRLAGGAVAGVTCDGEPIECEVVVNAGGAWARRIGELVGAALPVAGYRRQLVIFEPPEPFAEAVPMTMDYVPGVEREGLYFRDDTPGRLIAGLHWEGYGDWERPEDPDGYRQSADWEYAARVAEALARRWRGADAFRVTGGWAGLYPLTPDSQPIVGPLPAVAGFYNAVGAGGVGIQISPAIGAIVADLVVKGQTTVVPDLREFAVERFDSPGPS
jgi:glycine/D-amino acid oxidase-like deaminating enzyme